MHRELFYTKHKDKFTSPKHNLLAFQVKTNIAQDLSLVEVGFITLDTYKFLEQSCIIAVSLYGRYCSKPSWLLLFLNY